MRKLIIAAALGTATLAAPATARDDVGYVAIDAGLSEVHTFDLRYANSALSVPDGIRLRHKLGTDLDAVAGYDFGMFRLEAELGAKHATVKNADLDPAALAAVLDPDAPSHRYAHGHGNLVTAMVNALVDFGPDDSWNGSVGVGAGDARARYHAGLMPSDALNFSSQDTAFAWQVLGEVRAPVGSNIELGLKYRYFQTSLNFGPFCETTCTTVLPYRLHGKYRSNSVLASLIYNFGSVAAPPPPPPPAPPPPPPPAPATQTCPDGSVIDATAACPVPPPPPPPAASGERGR